MKPIVSPYLLRWTFEQMAQLERYSKASASGPIAIAEREISPALWDAYSIAMAQYLPAPLEVPVAFYAAEHDGRPWWHLFSTRSGPGAWGASWLPDHWRGTAG